MRRNQQGFIHLNSQELEVLVSNQMCDSHAFIDLDLSIEENILLILSQFERERSLLSLLDLTKQYALYLRDNQNRLCNLQEHPQLLQSIIPTSVLYLFRETAPK